jgi:hypothetical protein
MGCAASTCARPKAGIDAAQVRVEMAGGPAPTNIAADAPADAPSAGTELVPLPLNQVQPTSFGFIDGPLVKMASGLLVAAQLCNQAGSLAERVRAVAAIVDGAPLVEPCVVGSQPAARLVAVETAARTTLATITARGVDVHDAERYAAATDVTVVDAAIAAMKEVEAAADGLTFAVGASGYVQCGGVDGGPCAAPVRVRETRPVAAAGSGGYSALLSSAVKTARGGESEEVGWVTLADIKERKRQRLVRAGLLQAESVLADAAEEEEDELAQAVEAFEEAVEEVDEAEAERAKAEWTGDETDEDYMDAEEELVAEAEERRQGHLKEAPEKEVGLEAPAEEAPAEEAEAQVESTFSRIRGASFAAIGGLARSTSLRVTSCAGTVVDSLTVASSKLSEAASETSAKVSAVAPRALEKKVLKTRVIENRECFTLRSACTPPGGRTRALGRLRRRRAARGPWTRSPPRLRASARRRPTPGLPSARPTAALESG